jgi:hypothetical protein
LAHSTLKTLYLIWGQYYKNFTVVNYNSVCVCLNLNLQS